MTEGRLSRKIS